MGSSSYDLVSPDPHDFVKDADVILVQVWADVWWDRGGQCLDLLSWLADLMWA